jgi:hypothetical protein
MEEMNTKREDVKEGIHLGDLGVNEIRFQMMD